MSFLVVCSLVISFSSAFMFQDPLLFKSIISEFVLVKNMVLVELVEVSSTVVALGTGGWLEEAAQAGHGDYVLLHGLSGFQQEGS